MRCGFIVHPNSQIYGRHAYMRHSQFFEKIWASVKETRGAIMKSGCIWTSSATDTLTDHERTTIIVYFSKKGPAPVHQPRKKVGMMTEVTIHSHLCRRHVNSCFHNQTQLTILAWTCGFSLRALQGHEQLTCSEAFQTLSSVFPLLVASFKSSRGCHMSTQFSVHCVPPNNNQRRYQSA